ncbi:hypothetical protein ABK040_007140 [Willaertia magna]
MSTASFVKAKFSNTILLISNHLGNKNGDKSTIDNMKHQDPPTLKIKSKVEDNNSYRHKEHVWFATPHELTVVNTQIDYILHFLESNYTRESPLFH